MATPTPEIRTALLDLMAHIWHQATATEGKINLRVELTPAAWDAIIYYWPEIYLGTQQPVRLTGWRKLLHWRQHKQPSMVEINPRYLDYIRQSWQASHCFLLNGYTLLVNVLQDEQTIS